MVHHHGIFYYKRQSQKCIKLEIDVTFFKPQLDCIPLTILLFHRIALAAFVSAVWYTPYVKWETEKSAPGDHF